MTNPSHTYPPRLLRFVAVMLALTIPVAVGAVLKIASAPPDAGTAVGVALFFVAALAAEYKPVPLDEQGGRTVSLAFVFLLSTQFLFGWQYAVLGAIVSMVIVQVHNRAPAVRTMFNGASSGLSAFVSAGPGFILGWTVSPHHAGALTALVFMGGAAYVVDERDHRRDRGLAVHRHQHARDAGGLRPPLRAGLRDHGLHRRAWPPRCG